MFMGLLKPKQGAMVSGFTDIDLTTVKARVFYNLFLDFNSHTTYISFYVPHHENILSVIPEIDCRSVAGQVGNSVDFHTRVLGGTQQGDSHDYFFSGASYIFHEDYLKIDQISHFTKQFKDTGCSVQFYSEEFKLLQWGAIGDGVVPKLPSFEIRNGIIKPADN
jgi:hypothetical protein